MKKTRKIWIDLDGVLADFDTHYEDLFGIRPDRSKDDPPGFWDKVREHGSFFMGIPEMPDMWTLIHGIEEFKMPYEILTGCPTSIPDVATQKKAWVRNHLGDRFQVTATLSKLKSRFCQPGDFLIDDWVKYMDLWLREGGTFIVHRSAKESLQAIKKVIDNEGQDYDTRGSD